MSCTKIDTLHSLRSVGMTLTPVARFRGEKDKAHEAFRREMYIRVHEQEKRSATKYFDGYKSR